MSKRPWNLALRVPLDSHVGLENRENSNPVRNAERSESSTAPRKQDVDPVFERGQISGILRTIALICFSAGGYF